MNPSIPPPTIIGQIGLLNRDMAISPGERKSGFTSVNLHLKCILSLILHVRGRLYIYIYIYIYIYTYRYVFYVYAYKFINGYYLKVHQCVTTNMNEIILDEKLRKFLVEGILVHHRGGNYEF